MMMSKFKRLVPISVLAIGAVACGGGGPDLGKVKQDFDHPTGSTKDQQGVISVTGKQSTMSSNAGLSLGASVPGLGLTAEGADSDGFAEINPTRVFGNDIRAMRNLVLDQRTFGVVGVTSSSDVSCFNSPELIAKSRQAQSDYAKNGKAAFDASYTVDMASCQLDHKLSGKLAVNIKAEADSRGTFSYTVKYDFHSVCDSASGACVNGGFITEASLDARSAQATGSGGTRTQYGAGALNMISAWDYVADIKNATGGTDSIAVKGGLRIKAAGDGTSSSASIEYLFYVRDSHGAEVSYVLKLAAMTGGDTTLEIRGSDGKLSCIQHANLSGSCTGTGADGQPFSIQWTESDYSSVTKSDNFKKK